MESFILTDAPLAVGAEARRDLCGWVLAQAEIGPQSPFSTARLSVRLNGLSGKVEEIPLPVNLKGRITELIRLPDDVAGLSWTLPAGAQAMQPRLALRRVGRTERMLRMAYRVIWISLGLSEDQRVSAGLTLGRSLRDPEGAFRIATGFRARARTLRYADWIESFDVLRQPDVLRIHAHIERFGTRPRFNLLVVTQADGIEPVRATLASLQQQIYGEFTCVVLDCAGALDAGACRDLESPAGGAKSTLVARPDVAAWLDGFNQSLSSTHAGNWLMLVRAGDALAPHALYWIASEIMARPDCVIVYPDDDRIDAQGRRSEPRFKPDWSPTHFQSTDYIGAAAVVRGGEAAKAGGITLDCCRHGNYDLLLRTIEGCGDRIRHIPAVLYHRGSATGNAGGWDDSRWCADAVRAHFARTGVAAEVMQTTPGHRRVRYRLPEAPPLVSIIVPTRDALALLRQCVASVLEKTVYPRYEILVIDNQSVAAETLEYLAGLGARPCVRVLRYDRPFNYSAINNFAVREARGDLLCLLNNDTEVLTPDWLDEMAGHLLQRGVGAVGAMLYYPNGRVQHAGVTVGPGGCANHLHTELARDEPGYCSRALVAQEYSAVTAACMLTWKRLYAELGGLNERLLPISFNDVDYCLRLQNAGYRVVFTPHAALTHHESASRGRDTTWRKQLRAYRELKYMRTRWSGRMRHDPYYNLNLSYQRPDFSLAERPRVARPWSGMAP